MKCPECGTEMVWMGNVQIEIKDLDKYFHQLTKKAFQSKDVVIWGVDWANGDLFCPNYLNCGNHPVVRAERKKQKRKQKWAKMWPVKNIFLTPLLRRLKRRKR